MDDIPTLVRRLALSLIPMILSLSIHECAHAAVARAFGDKTAQKEGRLTLNPLVHIDPVGTLLFPILSVVSGGIVFLGWAKPVPVRPTEFRENVNRRVGMAVVSAAGPISNALIAVFATGTFALLLRSGVALTRITEDTYREVPTTLAILLTSTIQLNIGLCIFNLLPIPPLDGHRLVPRQFDRLMAPLQKYGFALLLVVFMFVPTVANAVFYAPVRWATGTLLQVFGLR